jgi:RNA polymerase sigma factor (TIGR02999 family)
LRREWHPNLSRVEITESRSTTASLRQKIFIFPFNCCGKILTSPRNSQVMPTEVTLLLDQIRKGDNRTALDELLPIVYHELRRLAGSFLNREYATSIQTTELVHEAYFRLTEQRSVDWQNRGQFFAIAAQAMRRILIDAARARKSFKRGAEKVSLDDAPTISVEVDKNLLDLDRALDELAAFDPDQARVVELRYFGGLTIDETADVLGVSPATVKREWAMARAWLYDRVKDQ